MYRECRFLPRQKRLGPPLDLKCRLIDHRQLGGFFAGHGSFIAHDGRFDFYCVDGSDVTAGLACRKNKFSGCFRFLRGDFRKLVGVAIAINKRRDLFLDGFCGDMKKIGANGNTLDLVILGIERIDLHLHPRGLGELLFGANAETRFCREKCGCVAAAECLAVD